MNCGAPDDDNIQPIQVDDSVRFSSIGGLKEHIKCLREMIIFPLMYPELFAKFKTRPAKGVLFHGPPGTGKTLLARALANECSLQAGRRFAFFMRKGADVLSKWYGESEKNLRLLFQKARKMKPSIIFFDEIDALASVRGADSDDRTSVSVVATLLAEMDGLCDRGDVIVIGATNRPDAIDPAVRRAGRFDRELYFPPPESEARRDILAIYTSDWEPSLSDETLNHLATVTVGYLGSDIKSLCSEAVLKAVRRVYPQIYETDYKLLINAKNVEVTKEDMLAAMEDLVPSGNRYVSPAARPLPDHVAPLLQAQLSAAANLLNKTFPPPSDKTQCNCGNDSAKEPSVFLVSGECAETYLAPALLAQLEHCAVKELSLSTLHSAYTFTPEQAVISLFADCRHTGRACVLFVRDLLAIWDTLARERGAAVLLQLWRMRSLGDNTLLLATCNGVDKLPIELQEIFPSYKDCFYKMRKPTVEEVYSFLMPVIKELPLVPPIVYQSEQHPPLPRAPPIGPRENEEDMVRRLYMEYDILRKLRVALEDICDCLSADRRYRKYTTPVDPETVPDYFEVVKQPMDLTTMTNKIKNRQYFCAKEFLRDIDLICTNAYLYSKMKADRKWREQAASLHTEAYAMVTEIDAQLEIECQLIARRRRERGGSDPADEGECFCDNVYFARLLPPGMDGSANSIYFSDDITSHITQCGVRTVPRSSSNKYNLKRKAESCSEGVPTKQAKMSRTAAPRGPPKNDKDKGVNFFIKDVNNKTHNTSEGVPNKAEGQNTGKGITFADSKTVLINTSDLDDILKKSVDPLSNIGLNALVDLHAQLSKAVYACSEERDRTRLPNDLRVIVNRYLLLAKN